VQNNVTLDFKVIRQGHAFGSTRNELPDPQNIRNKQNWCSRMCSSSDRYGLEQNNVTLHFKDICQGHAFGSTRNELPDSQNIINKYSSKLHA